MKKYNVLPLILLVYIMGTGYLGLQRVQDGELSVPAYCVILSISLIAVLLLRINLRRRYLKRKEEDDYDKNK